MSRVAALLGRVADIGLARPRPVIATAIAVLLLCIVAAAGLGIDTSRHSMVSAENPLQARQLRFF